LLICARCASSVTRDPRSAMCWAIDPDYLGPHGKAAALR
jgi:hypothetical protein